MLRRIEHSRQTIAHWTKNKVVPVSAHFLPAQTWRINYSAAMQEPFTRFRPHPLAFNRVEKKRHRCESAFRNLHFVAIVESEIDLVCCGWLPRKYECGIDLAISPFNFARAN
jgi:hypothetical protein